MDEKGLYIGHLPVGSTDAKLTELFGRFGRIRHIENRYLKGYAFVRFADPTAVERALVEPVHMMDGQVLDVERRSTRDYRTQKKEDYQEAEEQERQRKMQEGYEAEETDKLAELRRKRQAAAEARRKELDEKHQENVEAMERMLSDPDPVDEMPVIKKRTPPKQAPGSSARNAPQGMRRFQFRESSENEMVTIEGCGGTARYSVQGKFKRPFTEVSFDEDDEGPFIDFEEIETSLGIPKGIGPEIAEFFTSICVSHNFGGQQAAQPAATAGAPQGVAAGSAQPQPAVPHERQQPTPTQTHNPQQGSTATPAGGGSRGVGLPASAAAAQPAGRGRGRGRGRGT